MLEFRRRGYDSREGAVKRVSASVVSASGGQFTASNSVILSGVEGPLQTHAPSQTWKGILTMLSPTEEVSTPARTTDEEDYSTGLSYRCGTSHPCFRERCTTDYCLASHQEVTTSH
jgi:hypothetical protein